MSNSVLLWSTLILPWLTLFFIKKEEIRRFLPVAWFTTVITLMFYDFGITIYFWDIIKQNAYPLSVIPAFFLGTIPVITIWLFKFSYGKFWLYIALNAISDAIFAFLFCPWMVSRGIHSYINYLGVFLIAISLSVVIYAYQMLQEGAFSPTVKKFFSTRLKLAATKPFLRDKEDKR